MAEIEKQFLPTDASDADFPNDILQALLYTRERENIIGLEELTNLDWIDSGLDEEWKPMAQSIQTLLTIENERLELQTTSDKTEL
mmetsp:Transcript_30831/g.64365  ORF Transcript_30831/g.64365 Transcript_30831/m.64365 type:complete len:85 (-) Transcript_30831:45-299(-)